MGCRKLTNLTAIIAAFLLIIGASAFAVETTVSYNETTQEIEYSISDGEAGVEYLIHALPTGCVTAGAPPTIMGPAGSASVALSCSGEGTSAVRVEICKDVVCFAFYDLYFSCPEDCSTIKQIRTGVPTTNYFGILALILLISASAFFVYRKVSAKV